MAIGGVPARRNLLAESLRAPALRALERCVAALAVSRLQLSGLQLSYLKLSCLRLSGLPPPNRGVRPGDCSNYSDCSDLPSTQHGRLHAPMLAEQDNVTRDRSGAASAPAVLTAAAFHGLAFIIGRELPAKNMGMADFPLTHQRQQVHTSIFQNNQEHQTRWIRLWLRRRFWLGAECAACWVTGSARCTDHNITPHETGLKGPSLNG